MSSKKYVLDLTAVKAKDFPPGWPKECPLTLPCRVGRYACDWDLLPSKIPKPIYADLVKMIKTGGNPDGDETLPIGFRTLTLPPGAVIREVA